MILVLKPKDFVFAGLVFTASFAKAFYVEFAVAILIVAGGADCSFSSGFKVVCSGHTSFHAVE